MFGTYVMYLDIGRDNTMIMITENLATKITINNQHIPLCRYYEIRKNFQNHGQGPCKKTVKICIFSKMKLTSLLMKKYALFPSKFCPAF